MAFELTMKQIFKQELSLVQVIEFVNFMAVPDEVLNVVVGAISFNPDSIENGLREKKSKRLEGVRIEASEKVQSLYSSLVPSKGDPGDSKPKNKNGLVITPDLRAVEESVGKYEVNVTPDVTYIGRKNQKPELVFSDHMLASYALNLQLDIIKYPETSKLLAQVKRFDEWKRKVLRDIYVILGGVQREFFEDFDCKMLNILNRENLAGKINVTSSTVSRIMSNRWIEARDISGKQKYIFAKDLLITQDHAKKFRSLAALNEIMEEEFKKGKAYSDGDLSGRVKILARRTVMKYREASGIPPAYERKVFYKEGEKKEPYRFII